METGPDIPNQSEVMNEQNEDLETIDSFHIVSAHAPNSLVPRHLREITLKGATFIRLPMH